MSGCLGTHTCHTALITRLDKLYGTQSHLKCTLELPGGLTYLTKPDKKKKTAPHSKFPIQNIHKLLPPGWLHQHRNRKQSNTFSFQALDQLQLLARGNTSTFICVRVDLAGGMAVTSSASFAVLHIRRESFEAAGPALARSPRLRCSPCGAAFDVARGAAQRVTASRASPYRLILSAQAAHSCGLHPQQDDQRPSKPLPDQGPGSQEADHNPGEEQEGLVGGGIYLHTWKRCTAALNAGT